jgi:hypothetical protein
LGATDGCRKQYEQHTESQKESHDVPPKFWASLNQILAHKVNPQTTENYMGIPGWPEERRHSISEFGKYIELGDLFKNVNSSWQIILKKWIAASAG